MPSPTICAPENLDVPADLAWQPGLARTLCARADGHSLPAEDDSYGSWAWLTANREHGIYSHSIGGLETARFETFPAAGRVRYTALGLTLTDRPPTEAEYALVYAAIGLLDVGDQLIDAMRLLVRSIHRLESKGPGYDASHSDPALPFSIFVSLPVGERFGALRLAESMLHEAMHLQLTLLEHAGPLVHDELACGYSPWQQTERPLGGLMHGLFVFRVIDQWLRALAARRSDDTDVLTYAMRRRHEISQEIASLGDITASPALTEKGKRLVAAWLLGQGANGAAR